MASKSVGGKKAGRKRQTFPKEIIIPMMVKFTVNSLVEEKGLMLKVALSDETPIELPGVFALSNDVGARPQVISLQSQ